MVNTQTGEDLHIRLEETQLLDRDCTTLSRHVLQQLHFSPDAQDISALMNRIGLAGKLIARRLTRAGLLEDTLGFTAQLMSRENPSKRWISMPMMYLSLYLSKVALSAAWHLRRWKNLIISQKIVQLVAIPCFMTL